jgi:hypothetical protein
MIRHARRSETPSTERTYSTRLAPPRGAYDFPRSASFRIILSKVKFDTARRSREFSPLQLLQPPYLVQLQSPILTPPAVVGGLCYPDRP